MSDAPKADKQAEAGKPATTELNEKDLADVSGGGFMMPSMPNFGMPQHINIFRNSFLASIRNIFSHKMDPIHGPTWVNLMTYRKPGAASEPSTNKSVSKLFAELSAEEA